MTEFVTLIQNPFFWRQLAVGIVILVALLILKSIYRKLKWTILFLLFGMVILLFYGQLFFTTYSTEGERVEVEATSESAWQKLRGITRELFRFE